MPGAKDEFQTIMMSLQKSSIQSSSVHFISPEKWKNLMLKSLSAVSQLEYSDKDLIHDLRYVISNLQQDKFVQAILSFQPFKPKFRSSKFLDLQFKQTRMASTAVNSECGFSIPRTKLRKEESIIQKGSIIINKKNQQKKQIKAYSTIKSILLQQKESFLKQFMDVIIQEDTLKKQFEKKYHPFKKIIDTFAFILENKFKNLVQQSKSLTMQKMQGLLTYDILVLQKFMLKIAEPYQNVFHSENPEEVKCFKKKMNTFVKDFVQNNEKINHSIRKILRYYCRNSSTIKQIQQSIDDFVEVTNFHIPQDFLIDGCYLRSMNALMQFSETSQAKQSLEKLKEFRSAIAKDVDHFYQLAGQIKQRQIYAQAQIEIVRFILCKLKGWIAQIFSQLKFLEVVYGDEEIAYKYDDSSYIYAQLITVFDALEIEMPKKCLQIQNVL